MRVADRRLECVASRPTEIVRAGSCHQCHVRNLDLGQPRPILSQMMQTTDTLCTVLSEDARMAKVAQISCTRLPHFHYFKTKNVELPTVGKNIVCNEVQVGVSGS